MNMTLELDPADCDQSIPDQMTDAVIAVTMQQTKGLLDFLAMLDVMSNSDKPAPDADVA